MTLSEELTWRGMVNQTTYKNLSDLDQNPTTFYWGVDPSADSMTVGNLAAAMLVKTFMRHGHHAVLLIGGATGLVGDPDGKNDERTLLSKEAIGLNKQAIAKQYQQIFGEHDFNQVDNYDWFKDMLYLEFLRDIGKHVPMRQMLAREFVQSRLSEHGSGISYAEFSYVLIQAYDFLYLYENHQVTLQVCGADQWGNSIAGVDLIRRKTGGEAHVYSFPLVVNQTTGQKFGKTEDGAIWLDPKKTTPTQFYQFWVNTSDADVEAYLKIFTELDREDVERIMAEQTSDTSKRLAQRRLAEEATRIVHGEAEMHTARELTDFLTGSTAIAEATAESLESLRKEIASAKAQNSGSIVEALVATGLAESNTAARRLIQANAVSLNGQKVQREAFEESDFHNGRLIMRRGKAYKDSALIEL